MGQSDKRKSVSRFSRSSVAASSAHSQFREAPSHASAHDGVDSGIDRRKVHEYRSNWHSAKGKIAPPVRQSMAESLAVGKGMRALVVEKSEEVSRYTKPKSKAFNQADASFVTERTGFAI